MSGEWAVAGYRHVRQLGDGATGRVMLAVRESTGTPVAITCLPSRHSSRRTLGRAFQDEAQLITGLDDAGLVRLHEYAESPQGVALVSELVNGLSLGRVIRAEGRLPAEASLTVLKSLLLALGAAHRHGVMHGCVTPGNVLVAGDGTTRLAGLGVTACAFVSGNPRYQAPELRAGGPVTSAVDIYAATAIFYECLTGEPPSPSLEDVPAPVISLVTAGLAGDPNERPVTAPIFLGRLEAEALAAYGSGWEPRGRSQLAERAAVLKLLFPLSQKLVPEKKSALGRRGARRGGVASLAAALVLLGGTGAVVYAAGASDSSDGGALPAATVSGTPGDQAPQPARLDPSNGPSTKFRGPSPSGTSATPTPRDGRSRRPDGSRSPRPDESPEESSTPSASPSSPGAFQATGVQIVGLSLNEAGTTATAQVKVSGSGSGEATVTVQFFVGDTPDGDPVTVEVDVDGEATVAVSHTFSACPSDYSGEASAAPGTARAHELAAEGECSTA